MRRQDECTACVAADAQVGGGCWRSRMLPYTASMAMRGKVQIEDRTSCKTGPAAQEPQAFVTALHSPPRCMQACTASMNLSDEVDLEDYVSRPDKISNAEIAAICQEAGMHAVRKNRYVILPKDFEKGYKANVKKSDTDFEFYQ